MGFFNTLFYSEIKLLKNVFNSDKNVEGLKLRQLSGTSYEIYTSRIPSSKKFGWKPYEERVFILNSKEGAYKVYNDLLQINHDWKGIPDMSYAGGIDKYLLTNFIKELKWYTYRNRINVPEYDHLFKSYKHLLNSNSRASGEIFVCHNTNQWVLYSDYNGIALMGFETKEQAIEVARYLTRDYPSINYTSLETLKDMHYIFKQTTGKEPNIENNFSKVIYKGEIGKPLMS